MHRVFLHCLIFIVLTMLTQLGGLAWLIALGFRRRFLALLLTYTSLSVAAAVIAPVTSGRVPLPCLPGDALHSHSLLFCALNRHYVTPEMADVAEDLSAEMVRAYPDTVTTMLDGNFPFFDGFPLLPHLSHDDGEKLDIAFYWQDDLGYRPAQSRSPIGYWGYADGPTDCRETWMDLRWDMTWLNVHLPGLTPEQERMRHALRWLNADPRVGKVLIEPHVLQSLGVSGEKLRFQGCRAARHDDHIHVQLR